MNSTVLFLVGKRPRELSKSITVHSHSHFYHCSPNNLIHRHCHCHLHHLLPSLWKENLRFCRWQIVPWPYHPLRHTTALYIVAIYGREKTHVKVINFLMAFWMATKTKRHKELAFPAKDSRSRWRTPWTHKDFADNVSLSELSLHAFQLCTCSICAIPLAWEI